MTNKSVVTAALKNAGYYYDFATATLYMTAEFEKNSNAYGTNEYHLMNRILAKFPNATLKKWQQANQKNATITKAVSGVDLTEDGKAASLSIMEQTGRPSADQSTPHQERS